MQPSRRTLTLALSQTPGIGGKTVTRVLARNDVTGLKVEEFLELGPEALREEYKFKPKSAEIWVATCHQRMKDAAAERERLDGLGVIWASQADSHYPAGLEAFDPDPPGLIFLYGNQKLLKSKTVAVVASREARFDALQLIERQVENHVLEGRVLVSGHDTPEYQRAAVVPLRWGAPRILVLDSGLFSALGPELRDEPFAAARLWRFQFDPRTDLVVSAVAPRSTFHRNSNRIRDRLVFGLAQELDLAWVKKGGNMEKLAGQAIKVNRPVRVNPVAPGADSLLAAGASRLE